MRVIKLVADRQRERRASSRRERSQPVAGGGPLARRTRAGCRSATGRCGASALVVAVMLFYVILTPSGSGSAWLAWLAEFRARRRR